MATYFARPFKPGAATRALGLARLCAFALALGATAASAQIAGIKPASLDNAILGKSYSVTFTSVPKPVGYLVFWTATPGCLDGSGLTFTDNGNNTASIHGVAARVGSYTCVVTVSLIDPSSVSQTYTLRVVQPSSCVPPQITSGAPPAATAGVPYSFTVTATGTAPLRFAAMGLPAGLKLDAASGVISGTPQKSGSYAVSLVVSGCGRSALDDLTLVVAPPPPAPVVLSLSSQPNPAVFGQAITVLAHASDGAVPPTGSVLLCVIAPGQYCAPPIGAPPPGTAPDLIPPLLTAPLDGNGNATFTLTGLLIQEDMLQAYYGGDAGHSGATAGPLEQFVIKGVLIPAARASADPPSTPASVPTLSPTALTLLAVAVAGLAVLRRRRTRGS